MFITSKSRALQGCTLVLLAVCGPMAAAQTDKPKLAPAYEGEWDNLEEPISGFMRIAIDKVNPDGTLQGLYSRASRICSTDGMAMKGKLEGNNLSLLPDFGSNARCKDTKWLFQLQPDGTLTGTGESYYRLKAELKPVAK